MTFHIFLMRNGYALSASLAEFTEDEASGELVPRWKFVGDFRTRYEVLFEKAQLEAGNVTIEEVRARLEKEYQARKNSRKPKRDRYLRLRLGLEVI